MFNNDKKPVCGAIELTTSNSCFAYLTPLIDCVAVAHLTYAIFRILESCFIYTFMDVYNSAYATNMREI